MKNQNNSSGATFIIVLLVIVAGFVVLIISGSNNKSSTNQQASLNPVASEGSQIIEMAAKLGYKPQVISAKSKNDTTLQIKTNNTFDCSSSIRIPSLGINKTLPANGVTDIQIAAQAPGTTINGTCSMGMYHFQIKFI